MEPTNKETVETLNSLLRGEISAIETYNQAITKLIDDPIPELKANHDCHSARIVALTKRIRDLDGEPVTSSGIWGTFAKVIEGGANLFGQGAMIAALKVGEDRLSAEYRRAIGNVDDSSLPLLKGDLQPAQDRTNARIDELKQGDVAKAAGGSSSRKY